MTAAGRTRVRRSLKRRAILQGTQRIMLDEGSASVTFDRVATAAGVARGLVYYYFSTLDELFIAVLRDSTDRLVAGLSAATTAGASLPTAWEYAGDKTGTALVVKFLALANHRSSVRTAIGEGGERVRRTLAQVVAATWPDGGMFDAGPTSAAVSMLTCVPRLLAMEELLGTEIGHADAVAVGEKLLEWAEPAAR